MEAIEPALWLLVGLTAVAAFSLAPWIGWREWPVWARVGPVLAALAISVRYMEPVTWLLLGWTLVAACGLPVMLALGRQRRWLGYVVFVVVTPFVLGLLRLPQRLSHIFVWFMLLSSLGVVIWLVRPSFDSAERRTYARGLLLWSAICFIPVWLFWDLTPFERAISSVLNGEKAGRVQWELRQSAGEPEWLSEIPGDGSTCRAISCGGPPSSEAAPRDLRIAG